MRAARIQREAVAAIERAGGCVRYNWEYVVWDASYPNARYEQLHEKSWAPAWLVNVVGVDFFGHVTEVWIQVRPSDARTVNAAIGQLTALRTLELGLGHVTDVELEQLKTLTSLAKLNLSGTQVTDAGVKELNLACRT